MAEYGLRGSSTHRVMGFLGLWGYLVRVRVSVLYESYAGVRQTTKKWGGMDRAGQDAKSWLDGSLGNDQKEKLCVF